MVDNCTHIILSQLAAASAQSFRQTALDSARCCKHCCYMCVMILARVRIRISVQWALEGTLLYTQELLHEVSMLDWWCRSTCGPPSTGRTGAPLHPTSRSWKRTESMWRGRMSSTSMSERRTAWRQLLLPQLQVCHMHWQHQSNLRGRPTSLALCQAQLVQKLAEPGFCVHVLGSFAVLTGRHD